MTIDELKRKDDESDLMYKLRLYRNKEAYGLTYKDIGDILNKEFNQNFSEAKYRRPIEELLKNMEELRTVWFNEGVKHAGGNATGSTIFKDIKKREDALYKREVILRDIERENRQHLRTSARADKLQQTMIKCAEIISKEKPLTLDVVPKSKGDKIGVLLLSDWHFGEEIYNFKGEYNIDIATDKIKKMIADTIEYCKLNKVKTLKVLSLGDLMSGNIHVSTRVASELDAVEQTQRVAEIISFMLFEFAKEIENVELHSTVDNHGRINKKYTDHIEKESFTRFIPWHIEAKVKNVPNIKVCSNTINGIEEEDIGVVDIYDRQAIFVHGHNDSLIENKLKDLILMSEVYKPISVFMGHYHKNHETEIHGIDVIVNPAMVTTGDYAKRIRAHSLSRQKLVIYGKDEDGNVMRETTHFLNL